jgi:hypothetical protein
MVKETGIKLLRYEIQHIRYFNKLEDNLCKVFGSCELNINVPSQDYELLYMILDDLGVPEDSGYRPRDDYNTLYYNFCNSKSNDISKLIEDIVNLKKEKENESKKRVRK